MKKNWKGGVLVGAALLIATLGTTAITLYRPGSDGTTQIIDVSVSTLDVSGLTPRDFNVDFLRSLQAYIRQELTKETDRVSSEAVYLGGGKKLALIRLQSTNWNSAAIVGFVNDKLTRVVCTHPSPETVAISDGACGDKIQEVFHVVPENPAD